MKQTIYIFLLLMIGSIRYAYGDEKISVKLNNAEHKKEVVSLPFCNIFVDLQQGDDNEQYGISIKMENVSEENILLLFDRSYNEKTLKTMKLVYDKFFPGTKKKRITEACAHIPESYRLSPSSETINILNYQYEEKPIKCRLPIYIARYNEKKILFVKKARTSMVQKEVIELNIDVEIKPDEDYFRLLTATDSLINEIDGQTFCSNKNHKGTSLEELHLVYNKSIDDLKRQVLQIISSRNYMSTDKGYKDLMTIHDKLNTIDIEKLTVTSCDNDKKKEIVLIAHKCKYCSLSAENIYKKLESYYIDLYNGRNTKQQVIRDVEALFNCARKNVKRDTGSFMPRISLYYNKIKSK